MDFNQLITTNPNDITEGQRTFLQTHNAIVRAGNIVEEFAVNMAVNLKTMRDGKFYTEAGFSTFEDYTENAVGLKRRQAYNYIKVVETFGEDFVQSTAQKIGITKLELLTHLTEEERDQVATKGKAEDASVRELKERIKELQQDKEDAEANAAEVQDELDKLKSVQSTARNNTDEKLKKKIEKLEAEVNTLKSKPAEKEIVKDEKTEAELKKAKDDLSAKDKLIADKETELERLKKQATLASDESYVKFKVTFEAFQKLSGDLLMQLSALPEEKREKAKKAIQAMIGGIKL